ncbi:MAG TPA: hypothetical protein VJH03_11705 [Blastocatellia bacterium]|nr:hypothetical protein [Blastocatellia bacterium]
MSRLLLGVICLCAQSSNAQPKKGDKELSFVSGGFSFNFGGDGKPTNLEGSGSFFSSSFQNFNVGGRLGYFLTSRNEIGAGTFLSVFRDSFCKKSFFNGQITDEGCDSDTDVGLGFSGFYRYNFVRGERKGFPFVGATIGVSDVTSSFTGNVALRPEAGYKYFFKKNVALDFSVGYTAQLNKVDEDRFTQDRRHSVNGQFGLSFIF